MYKFSGQIQTSPNELSFLSLNINYQYIYRDSLWRKINSMNSKILIYIIIMINYLIKALL